MNVKKKLAALAVVGAMVVGGVSVASSASAAVIPGTITVTPTSGNVSSQYWLDSIAVSVGAPVGFRTVSASYIYQNGVEKGSVSNGRTPTTNAGTFGTFGLDGNPSYADRSIVAGNNFVTNKKLNDPSLGLVTGQFELRNYYFASGTSPDRVNDPYTSLLFTYNSTTGAWSVYTPPVPLIPTTTSLTASASGNTVTLTATVNPAGIAGEFNFFENGVAVTDVTGINGVGTATLVVGNGPHTYTAQFVSSNPLYADSPVSGTATVQVGGIQAQTFINVTIPNNVGALTLTGVSSSVSLGTAAYNSATNTLDATSVSPLVAVVTDSRQLDFPAWSLTGQVGNFNNGTYTILGKYLGWTPSVSGSAVAGPQSSVAGAVVAPAPTTVDGISAISTFATGQPNVAGTVTNASAVLLLKAPANTPQGAYSALLTLTLI